MASDLNFTEEEQECTKEGRGSVHHVKNLEGSELRNEHEVALKVIDEFWQYVIKGYLVALA